MRVLIVEDEQNVGDVFIDYLLGLGKVREKLVLLLDSARLLTAGELLATAEVIPELPPGIAAPAPTAESAA